MKRVLVVALLLAACGTNRADIPAAPEVQRSVTQIETGEGTTYTITQMVESNIRSSTISGTPQTAWTALPRVFEELGVPVTLVDPQARLLGTMENRVRRIGRERPARYLECGSGLAGQYANIYDVYLTVVTQLHPAPEGSVEVRTRLEAMAKDAGHGNNPVRCSSKGVLERLIVEGLQARLAGGAN